MQPALGETIVCDFITYSGGAAADADELPTCEVFEDANDTPILSPTVTKRTGRTGHYRVSIACTTGNGFEAGKSYNIIANGTVDSNESKTVLTSFILRKHSIDVWAQSFTLTTTPTDLLSWFMWSILRDINFHYDKSEATLDVYGTDGTTVITTQDVVSNDTEQSIGLS